MLGINKNQVSFADYIVNSNLSKKIENSFLTKIDKIIDFKPINSILNDLYTSKFGRPSIPPLVMFKMLLIQQYYNLSDPELEFAVADRISFRQFAGLSFDDSVPDETSMVRFRQRLIDADVIELLFKQVNSQLEKHLLIVRKATLIDATLVDSPTKRVKSAENQTDIDASYTTKRGKLHYGYKAHVSVDKEHKLIEKCAITSASVHDSNVFEELIPDETEAVYADKAYASGEHSELLENKGIRNGILEKAYRKHPLTEAQVESNKEKARIRSSIERVFAHLKRWLGYRKVRYIGLLKNELELYIKAIAYNFKRTSVILM
jgi:transposase, IS5 family